MSIFVFEPLFWRSLGELVLRVSGLSSRRPYRVLVRVEPLWWKESKEQPELRVGIYTTAIVIAANTDEAKQLAGEVVKRAVTLSLADRRNASMVPDPKKCTALRGIVWRAPRGFTLYPLE